MQLTLQKKNHSYVSFVTEGNSSYYKLCEAKKKAFPLQEMKH